MTGRLLLLGGPAGAGKSTLARAWCATRPVAAHLPLDDVRDLLVQGRVDPRDTGDPAQHGQWRAAVEATCAAALAFARRDVDVVIDDLMYPTDVEQVWVPLLAPEAAMSTTTVIVLPRLDVLLERGGARAKSVPAGLVAEQHRECGRWPNARRVDTSDLSVEESLAAVVRAWVRLEARAAPRRDHPAEPAAGAWCPNGTSST